MTEEQKQKAISLEEKAKHYATKRCDPVKNWKDWNTIGMAFLAGASDSESKKYTADDMIRLAIHCWSIASRPNEGAVYNINDIANKFMESLK